ncbi:hypothetical protein ACFSUD_10415 [Sulfitobacter aestuarii]|uniref:Uncharacterized protein n=1 Tax=Sulfitobacter aestuarii TaxID=2161676 RepID=A0ABW5U254_9RHOB
MRRDVEDLVREFENDGLQEEAERFLSQYPDSPRYLTERELREQIMYFPVPAGFETVRRSA